MQLQYDDALLESAVFLCSGGKGVNIPHLQIHRFHREREKLYAIRDPDERSTAYFKLHLAWFREWGLEQPIEQVLSALPLLRRELALLAFRKAGNRSEEGAELFVNGTVRNAVVALRPERFRDQAAFLTFLRHEFMHLNDMLDPDFAYSPDAPPANPAHERLTRERYRLLWDVCIDGRLAREGHTPVANRDLHWREFQRAYAFWSDPMQNEVFQSLWEARQPSHDRLMELASDPRGLRFASGPLPGGPCPLCAFPTFDWTNANSINAVRTVVSDQFPEWSPEHGMCGRCFEIYQVLASTSHALA